MNIIRPHERQSNVNIIAKSMPRVAPTVASKSHVKNKRVKRRVKSHVKNKSVKVASTTSYSEATINMTCLRLVSQAVEI